MVWAWLAVAAPAALGAIDEWRAQVAQARVLAENDVPQAYREARRLAGELPADAAPADRVRALNLLARTELYMALTDAAAQHAQQAFELAARNGDKIGQAEADLNTALNAVNEARIDRLVEATTRSLSELEGANRPDLLAEAMLRTAVMYRRTGQLDDSVTMAMQTMEVARRLGNPLALAYAHQGLAISFDQSFRLPEAREHYEQMRVQARAARSKQLEAFAMLGLGGLQAREGDRGGGERLTREAIALFRETGAPFAINYGLAQLATSLGNQGRHAEALVLLDEVVATYERYPNKIGLWYTLNARSGNHQALGQHAAARADAERAYTLAKQIDFPLYVSESALRVAALAAAAGDHRRAYALMVEANEMTAQAARERASARMLQLAQRYEAEAKQREINELTQRNREQRAELERALLRQRLLWIGLGTGVLVFVGIVYFLLRLRRSQGALQRQTAILQSVLDSMADGVVVADRDGRLLLVNPAAEKILGLGLTEAEAPNWSERYGLYLPDQRTLYPEAELPLVRAVEGASSDNVEIFARQPQAAEGRWLSVAGRPLAAAGSGERGGVVVFSDVTAQKRAEAALRVREQEFRALVEHAPDLVARYDTDCRRTYANPALARTLQMSPDRLLGARPTDIAELADDQARRYEQRLRDVIAGGADAAMDVQLGGANYQFRFVAERGLDGRVASVLAIGRDVTVMMETQRQLTTLLDNLPDMVARFDREGRYLYVNPTVTRHLGLPAERFAGRTLREMGFDPLGQLSDALTRAVAERRPTLTETQSLDGQRFFEVRHVPELDERGEAVSVLAVGREVTERKRVEQLVRDIGFRREAAREEERKFIARELHDELGQLLSALRLEVSVLRLRHGQDDAAIGERAAGMLKLVDSVIRLQRDLVSSLRPAVLDMGIGAALEWLVGEFSARSGIACTLELAESHVALDADQTTMVFRIVQESLTNVARHAHATRARVLLERSLEGYRLLISDDGCGFDPGARRDPKSLGLVGLQERAQMLGGQLEIDSRRGGGTSIVLRFPALQAARRPVPAGVGGS